MGLYGEEKDYEQLVKANITRARILSTFPKEYYSEVNALLDQKDQIIEENGLFAGLKLRSIDKKIDKLREKATNESINKKLKELENSENE